MYRLLRPVLLVGCLVSTLACSELGTGSDGEQPSVVVTTSILGDVVANLVGDEAEVTVLMPRGIDPHDFAPSPKQAISLREADFVLANGAGFESGLDDALKAAVEDGVTVVEATELIEVLELDGGGADPHFFTDPSRMATAARKIADRLREEIPELDQPEATDRAAAYVADLERADSEIDRLLSAVPSDRRKLITNHEVFGYFAERYDFEVIGAVIPGGSTLSEPSAREVTELARTVVREKVPAIFGDTSSPSKLADAVTKGAGGDVAVVELYSESLGPEGSDGATYLEMITTNAKRIAEALS